MITNTTDWFGKLCKQRRGELGISQYTLASLSGLSRSMIDKTERGLRVASNETASKIFNAFVKVEKDQ